MVKNALFIFALIFICIFIVAFGIYIIFFGIYKYHFNKQLKLMKRYNYLNNTVSGFNSFNIDVLHNNKLLSDKNFKIWKTTFTTLENNIKTCEINIDVLRQEINDFNIGLARKHIKMIEADITENEKQLEWIKTHYVQYTQYSNEINSIFHSFQSSFELIKDFYEKNLRYREYFTQINLIFNSMSEMIIKSFELTENFDYKKTMDTIIALKSKQTILIKAINKVLLLQNISDYLKLSVKNNQLLINSKRASISNKDLPEFQRVKASFKRNFEGFLKAYLSFNLHNAESFLAAAAGNANWINKFCKVNIKTNDIFSFSIEHITKQTNQIIKNRDKLILDISKMQEYFSSDKKIVEMLDVVIKDVNVIDDSVKVINSISHETYVEKKDTLTKLIDINDKIFTSKKEINDLILKINNGMKSIITTIDSLNDLYVFYWQAMSALEQYCPNTQEMQKTKQIINSSLEKIENFTKQIISNPKTDYINIMFSLGALINNSQEIYKKINSAATLKSYASNLFMYANRYQMDDQFADRFVKAKQAFDAKEYALCIDILISICNNK